MPVFHVKASHLDRKSRFVSGSINRQRLNGRSVPSNFKLNWKLETGKQYKSEMADSTSVAAGMGPRTAADAFLFEQNAGYQSMAPPRVEQGVVVKTEPSEDDLVARYQRQRERNREAVRNCRKRKREHAQLLKDRVEKLLTENSKLRLELSLGDADSTAQATSTRSASSSSSSSSTSIILETQKAPNHNDSGIWDADAGREIIQELVDLVRKSKMEESDTTPSGTKARKTSDTDMALRRKVQVYMERHQDHGRDRQKAIGFILGRLQRLVEPEILTKQYLHIMTTEMAENRPEEAPHIPGWSSLLEEMQLTPAQQEEFSKRVKYAFRLRTELDCAFEKMRSIVQRCRRNKKVGDSLSELTQILKPEQFARFVAWVHSNPACKDILDELWGKLLTQCDIHINKEIASNPVAVTQIKRFQENSAALATHLFSVVDPQAREDIARLCVHEDVVLVDANNNLDKRGVSEVTKYMSYVTRAFDAQSCEKTNSLRALDVMEKSIVSDQQDDKVTGTWRLSGVYIGKLRPQSSNEESEHGNGSPFGLGAELQKARSELVEEAIAKVEAALKGNSVEDVSSTGLPRPDSKKAKLVNGPLLSKEEQNKRTVTFNVIIEFSFADPTKPELITEMIISWDAMALVGQLGLLEASEKGVLPPPKSGGEDGAVADTNSQAMASLRAQLLADSHDGEEAAKLRRFYAESFQTLFETDDVEVRKRLAEAILDRTCIFDDTNVGNRYTGVSQCLVYVKKLRSAFSRLRIRSTIGNEKPVFVSRTQRRRSSSSGSLHSDISSRSSKSSSPLSPKGSYTSCAIELRWEIDAEYGGALVRQPQACRFTAKVFLTTSTVDCRIRLAKLDMEAQDLMHQLGILNR